MCISQFLESNATQLIPQSDHTATHWSHGSWPCFAAESPKLFSKNSTRAAKEIWEAFCSYKKRQKHIGWWIKNWQTDNTDTHRINKSRLFKTTVRPARFTLMITGAFKQCVPSIIKQYLVASIAILAVEVTLYPMPSTLRRSSAWTFVWMEWSWAVSNICDARWPKSFHFNSDAKVYKLCLALSWSSGVIPWHFKFCLSSF